MLNEERSDTTVSFYLTTYIIIKSILFFLDYAHFRIRRGNLVPSPSGNIACSMEVELNAAFYFVTREK